MNNSSSITESQRAIEYEKAHSHLVEQSDESQIIVDQKHSLKCPESSDLIDLALQIQNSEKFVRTRAVGRLEIIAEQMRYLNQKARIILEEAHRDNALHHAACNFKKIPGNVYYLYTKSSGQKYWSMISPSEWGPKLADKYLNAYRLEVDKSWTVESEFIAKSRQNDLMDQILTTKRPFVNCALEFSDNDKYRSEKIVQY